MNKDKIIILGSGSSVGVPRIDGYWGKANKNDLKNNRTRCSIYIKHKSYAKIQTPHNGRTSTNVI
jgi:phosphoribosyl 1,2-cyclic phosphate phosphodiesterase